LVKNRVAFIIDTLNVGGAEKSLFEITSRFKRFEPVFITLFEGDDLYNDFIKQGIRVYSLKHPKTFLIHKLVSELIPIIEEINPVIIHSTLFHSDMVSRILKRKFNISVVNSLVNDSYGRKRYYNLNWLMKSKLFAIQLMDMYSAKYADLFISNSETIKNSNAKALKIPSGKIAVIPRGRDLTKFQIRDFSGSEKLRIELGLKEKIIFINVGRLIERKGQLELIHAFKIVHDRIPGTHLLLVGEGPFHARLSNEIINLKLDTSVSLLGNRNDVPDLLKMSDYFIFPSLYEGLPGALVEAMMAKIPIICSDIPENRECVDDSKAIFFEPGNVDDIAKKMMDAVKFERWEDLIENAYKKAVLNFDINHISQKYEDTYLELLENKNKH
jgi:glycosyltransferase involved in cell wall biosynthesis